MKLADWLKIQKPPITQDEFGRRLNLSQSRISQITRAGTNDLSTAMAIEKATGGAVTVAELAPPEATAA